MPPPTPVRFIVVIVVVGLLPAGGISLMDPRTRRWLKPSRIRGQRTWGNGFWGQTDPPDGEFTRISAGDYYMCGIRPDRTICWHWRRPSDEMHTPEGEFTTLGAGHWATCGLRTDRTITCWHVNGA